MKLTIKGSKKIFEKSPGIKSVIFFTTIMCSLFLCLNLSTGNDYNSKVEDVALSEPIEIFDVTDVGVNYKEIVLVVSVLKTTKESVSYSFSASLIPCTETTVHR